MALDKYGRNIHTESYSAKPSEGFLESPFMQSSPGRMSGLELLANATGFLPGARFMLGTQGAAYSPEVEAVVKPKGGSWLSEGIENLLKPLRERLGETDPARLAAIRGEGLVPPHAGLAGEHLAPWMRGPLTKYIKTYMGTKEDPVRQLAEQGILHFTPPDEAAQPTEWLIRRRETAGQNPHGAAVSPLAKAWESATDKLVGSSKAGSWQDYINSHPRFPTGIEKDRGWLLNADPSASVFNIASNFTLTPSDRALGLRHLMDELSNAMDPTSGLPRHLQLTPEAVKNMGMEKAVRRVADINAWRAAQKVEANQGLAEKAVIMREYPHSEATPNPKGLRWVELKAPDQLPAGWSEVPDSGGERFIGPNGNMYSKEQMRKIPLADQLKYEGDTMGHCVGGYCDDVLSGRLRIFSLRDAKGEPHTTVEVIPGDWKNSLTGDTPDPTGQHGSFAELVNAVRLGNGDFNPVAERLAQEHGLPSPPSRITQIKGKQNRAPNEEYLPFVQDFVRNSPTGQPWSNVGDLGNTGLVDLQRNLQDSRPGEYGQLLSEFGRYVDPNAVPKNHPLSTLVRPLRGYTHGGTIQHFAEGGTVDNEIDPNAMDDESLKQFILTGKVPDKFAKYTTPPHLGMTHPPAQAEYTPGSSLERAATKTLEGMSAPQRMLVGAGANLSGLGSGIANLGAMGAAALMPEDKAKAVRQQIAQERTERAQVGAALSRDPAAVAGGIVPYIAGGMAAPARIGAQTALQAGMAGFEDPSQATTGLGGELLSRGLHAGVAGGTNYGLGKLIGLAGKTTGGLSGRFTPEGAEAMRLRDAAQRELGLKLRLADLDPNSTAGQLQAKLPGGAADIVDQAAALRRGIDATKQVPSATGLSSEARVVPGEGLRMGVVEAADKLKADSTAKWNALDDYIITSGVKPIIIQQTHAAGKTLSPESLALVDDYAPQVGGWLAGLPGTTMKQALQNPVGFSHVNELRMGVGKALGKAGRDFERAAPGEKAVARRVKTELSNLYRSVNDDLTNWGGRNAQNKEAMDLFHNANDFYRERIVPDIINNPVVAKAAKGQVAGANPKAFKDTDEIIRSVVNRPEIVDRLQGSMSPRTEAMVNSLRAAGDARKYMLTGELPATGLGDVGSLLSLALGHPVTTITTAASRLPGLHQMANSRAGQAVHFGKDVLQGTPAGRAAFGAVQYPAQAVQQSLLYPFERK